MQQSDDGTTITQRTRISVGLLLALAPLLMLESWQAIQITVLAKGQEGMAVDIHEIRESQQRDGESLHALRETVIRLEARIDALESG